MKAINRGFFLSAFISAAAVFVISGIYMDSCSPAIAVSIGLVLAAIIQVLTQYFTDTKYKPVQEIAESTVTGPATTVLSGFSVGLESTVWSALILAGAIVAAFLLAGRIPERSPSGCTSSRSPAWACSPPWASWCRWTRTARSRDNAQGIAEMSGEFEGRPAEILGGLDAVGNSTKAITKGMAIATAVIAATSLFGSFEEALEAPGFFFEGIRIDRARRAGGTARRRHDRVPVLLARDPSRGTRGGARWWSGGPQAVPRPPRDHGLLREAGLRARSSTSARRPRCASC